MLLRIKHVIRPFVRLYPRVLKLIWRANGWRLIAAAVLALFGAVSGPLQIWISAAVIDRIVSAVASSARAITPASMLFPLLVFAVLWGLSHAATTLQGGLNEIMSDRTYAESRFEINEKACSFDLAFFDSGQQTGRLELLASQNWRLYNSTTMLITVLGQFATGITLIGLLLSISPLIPIVLCLAVLPRVFVRSYFAHRLYAHYTGKNEVAQLSGHTGRLLTQSSAAKDVRLFGLGEYLMGRYRAFTADYLRGNQEIILARERAMLPVGLLSVLGTSVSWGIATVQALSGSVTAGGLAAVFQGVQQLGQTFDTVFDQLGYLYSNNPFLSDYFAFLDMPVDVVPGALRMGADCATMTPVPTPIRRGVSFEHVSFIYPESNRPVLDDVSFELGPGERLAIVGENGAGKSTLSKLIARLYDPTSGIVTLDGVDLRCYDKHAYYRQVSAVFQDYPQFHLSARENIGFGDVTRLADEVRIRHAAELGGATAVLERLPGGLDTMLGKTIARGVDLSGGEWQRLALARAFMREAQILIMDEPSAALDPLAERDIYRRFVHLSAGKMTVLISHRLASCKMADRILVLEHGKIIEEGSHEALMTKGGRYAAMYTAQAEQYVPRPLDGKTHAEGENG